MRKSAFHLPRPLLAVLICIALSSAPSGVAQQRRALPTHLAAPATEPAVAPVPTEQSIRFGLTLPLRNRAALEALLHEQRDPSSPHYRQYLTAQQFLQQYGRRRLTMTALLRSPSHRDLPSRARTPIVCSSM
jgi:subtilase family serine protease